MGILIRLVVLTFVTYVAIYNFGTLNGLGLAAVVQLLMPNRGS